MSDDKKTTKEEEKPATDTPKSTDEKKEEKVEEVIEEVKKEEKAAMDEVIEEAEKEKPKKGKSQYAELKNDEIMPGMIIRVHQKIVDTNAKGEEKERVQVFQGMVLAHKHGAEAGGTITVRKVSGNIGVEKIFPLNMPSIDKIEMVRKYKVTQARPYFLRTHKKRLSEVKE
jgi:large subunit ribosomal protein L19